MLAILADSSWLQQPASPPPKNRADFGLDKAGQSVLSHQHGIEHRRTLLIEGARSASYSRPRR
jgi:hypothetical protein